MLTSMKSALSLARERARLRRSYRFLLAQSDAMLTDIGVDRGRLHRGVLHGRDAD